MLAVISFFILIGCSNDDETRLANTAPTIADQSFSISEDASIGTSIGWVVAEDGDGDPIIFSITGGNDDENFQIGSQSGELTISKMLDFETTSSYELTIQVEDDLSSTTATITITVLQVSKTGLFDQTILHGNLQREYLLYIPENYTGSESFPVVFSLHGAGGTKESQYELSQFDVLADREEFILVTPEATSLSGNLTFWNQNSASNRADDVGFIAALVDELSGRYNVDLDRIYLAGSSNGGFMALEITCKLSNKIAAVAAVKGYMTPDQISSCDPTQPTAIIQMHGTEDPLVNYEGVEPTIQYWKTFNRTDASAIVSTLPDTDPNNGNTTVSNLYANGINGVEVVHLQIVNGVHDWFGEPGTDYDINASEEAWAFFNRFDKNGLR